MPEPDSASSHRDEEPTTTTTRVAPPRAAEERAEEPRLYINVQRADDRAITTILAPTGTAAALTVVSRLTDRDIEDVARGFFRMVPPQAELERRGAELARRLLGEAGVAAVERCGAARAVLVHDVASAGLPFELLRVNDRWLGIHNALVRRPALERVLPANLFVRPAAARPLRVQLVVNPTSNLGSADAEAAELRALLGAVTGVELMPDLAHADATRAALLGVLARPDIDVLHFAGHGFHRGPEPDQSGLECADGDLTVAALRDAEIRPRLAFMNACETGRIRGAPPPDPALAFAEVFLRAGVEAYLGCFWEVRDQVSARFAANVYRGLGRGRRLFEAVADARGALLGQQDRDWASYVLYGDASLRMRRPPITA